MPEVIRTEEWTVSHEGMLSTLVMDVLDGDRVNIAKEYTKELKLDPADSVEVVPVYSEQFVDQYPYERIRIALITAGFTYVRTA